MTTLVGVLLSIGAYLVIQPELFSVQWWGVALMAGAVGLIIGEIRERGKNDK